MPHVDNAAHGTHVSLRAIGAACVVATLLVSSVALAAPRPSGVVAASSTAAVTEEVVAPLAVFTRADMPRPSGDAANWLHIEPVVVEEPQTGPTKLPAIQALAAGTAPATADEEPGDAWWTADMDCTPCHAAEDLVAATADSTVLTDENGTVVNPHAIPDVADHAAVTCANCHKSHEVGENIAKTASRACVSCHHAYVYECYTCHE